MIEVGNLVEFKRHGPVPFLLGGLLKMLDHKWNGWGWHLAIVWEKSCLNKGWYIMEALAGGVEINYYSMNDITTRCRIHHWLDQEPTSEQMAKFLKEHLNMSYDVTIYFWTTLQYLVRHFFNRRIPRLLDARFTCWELVFEFCEELGKPIGSKYDCPMISDFIRVVGGDYGKEGQVR